jgi:hypothetical protein
MLGAHDKVAVEANGARLVWTIWRKRRTHIRRAGDKLYDCSSGMSGEEEVSAMTKRRCSINAPKMEVRVRRAPLAQPNPGTLTRCILLGQDANS